MQLRAVLDGFGITESDLSDYKTIEITNKDEHDYLGDYMSDSVIGTRALSSVMVVKADENSGVNVSTKHITYCTSGMYCNALVTAGLSDAKVTVVGPFDISGTSALVGAMKAYSVMTGEEISEKTMDTATDELVTTAEVAKNVGDKQKVTELVAAAKKAVFEDQLSSETDIRDAIEQAANELSIDLSDDDELNDLLFVTNLLITDYSSAIFEASLLDIPMIFYAFDLYDYISNRDFYYDFENFVPGKIVFSENELITAVKSRDFDYEKVGAFKTKFFDNLDGNSSKRVADEILKTVRGEI